MIRQRTRAVPRRKRYKVVVGGTVDVALQFWGVNGLGKTLDSIVETFLLIGRCPFRLLFSPAHPTKTDFS